MNTLTVIFCIALPLFLVCMFLWLREREQKARRREIAELGVDYHDAIAEAREHPSDPDLQLRARELGRRYAEMIDELPERTEHPTEQ